MGIRGLFALLVLLLMAGSAAAQDVTPEPSPQASAEATPEVTATLAPGAMLDFPGPGSYTVRQEYPSGERTYRVYIPTTYAAATAPLALVLVLHGAGGNGASTESFTGFDALADQDNFIVAYPDGLNNVWNDGRVGDPRIGNVDDLRFLSDVVLFLRQKLSIDPNRVYASGYSMGGMMSYRLGCLLPDRFAAIASVASTMPQYLVSDCTDSTPIPLMVFQGTDDPIVPWVGVASAGLGYLSAAQTLGFWGDHNHCTSDFTMEALPNGTTEDYTRVVRQQLANCAADVVLYGIYFGGHTWPGHPFNATASLGQTTLDIDATALIWDFFNSHPKAPAS